MVSAPVSRADVYNMLLGCAIPGPGPQGFTRAPAAAAFPYEAGSSFGPIECTVDTPLVDYLNADDSKTALHVPQNLNWAVCASNSSFNYSKTEMDETITTYPVLINAGLRILIYSGDQVRADLAWQTFYPMLLASKCCVDQPRIANRVCACLQDACLPTSHSVAWINALHLNTTAAWHPYLDDTGSTVMGACAASCAHCRHLRDLVCCPQLRETAAGSLLQATPPPTTRPAASSSQPSTAPATWSPCTRRSAPRPCSAGGWQARRCNHPGTRLLQPRYIRHSVFA